MEERHQQPTEKVTTESTAEQNEILEESQKGSASQNVLQNSLGFFLGCFTGTVLATYAMPFGMFAVIAIIIGFLIVLLIGCAVAEFVFGMKISESDTWFIPWYYMLAVAFLGALAGRLLFNFSPFLTVLVGLVLAFIYIKSVMDTAKTEDVATR